MPHFNLRYVLETIGERKRDAFIVQIGAMDGCTFDPVHEFITRYNWNGLVVEPVHEHFVILQETYRNQPGLTLANTAIGDHDGTAILHRIPHADVANGNTPRWGYGVASLYTDRNALAFAEVKPYIIEEEVVCQRLPSLLAEHNVTHIDVLQIDAEGHDYHVLSQLDFATYTPLIINLEFVNLPKAEQTACKRLLDTHGYIHAKGGYDLLAVSPRFFKEFL